MAVSTKEDEHLQFPVKLGIGGFGMGAAVALYSAQCYALGRFSNRLPYRLPWALSLSVPVGFPSQGLNP